jgi:hypothetical protein
MNRRECCALLQVSPFIRKSHRSIECRCNAVAQGRTQVLLHSLILAGSSHERKCRACAALAIVALAQAPLCGLLTFLGSIVHGHSLQGTVAVVEIVGSAATHLKALLSLHIISCSQVRTEIKRAMKPLDMNVLENHAPFHETPQVALPLHQCADEAVQATVLCLDAFVKTTATTRTPTTAAVTPTGSDATGLQRTCSWNVQHYEVTVVPCGTLTGTDAGGFVAAATRTKRLSCDHHMFQTLAVDRRGDVPHSNMTTLELEQLVDGKDYYVFQSGKGITAVHQHEHAGKPLVAAIADFQHKIRHFSKTDATPATLKYQTISGSWDQRVRCEDGSNILGGSGVLSVYTDQTKIAVPVMTATEEHLSYYGAHLLSDGDVFQFQTSEAAFPIFTMHIGVHYVSEYIIKKGMGLYLER